MTHATPRPGQLDDKVVLITGAAQGIGFATAELAAQEGAHVIIGDVQIDKGKDAAQQVNASFVEMDVTSAESIKTAVDTSIAQFGRIDVLVNNAGAVKVATSLDTTVDEFRRILDLDLTGVFAVTNEVGRHMISAGRGSIVNLASVASFVAMAPEPLFAYSATKAAVAQMARNLALEWAKYGIRANSVSPGRIRTPLLIENASDEWMKIMLTQPPIGRLIEPSEVAAGIVFLASDQASAITGHNLVIDGGLIIT